jgi:hypothetical protein
MAVYWRQGCHYQAQDQHGLGVEALAVDDVVRALLHLRAAVRLDCHIQHRAATASVYERGARLWYESADVRDEIRRREDLARKPGRWLYDLTPSECGSHGFISRDIDEETAAVHQTRKP